MTALKSPRRMVSMRYMVLSTALLSPCEKHPVAFLPTGSKISTAPSCACHLQNDARPLGQL